MISNQKNKKNRFFKIKLMLGGLFFALLIIFLRLYHLQVKQQQQLQVLGTKNCIKTEVVLPLRGNFFDAKNVLLAANRPVFDLYWHGAGKPWSAATNQPIFDKVCSVLKLTPEQANFDQIRFAHRYGLKRLVKEDLSFDELCKVSEQCAHLDFLFIKNRFERVYPYKMLASHLLGYLSKSEKIGCSGLEQVFEDTLRGEVGCVHHTTNSVGKELGEQVVRQSQPGVDLRLTLDFELQSLAESLFEPGQSGAFLLMDAESGALRVFLSYPNYDPNLFLGQISEKMWNTTLSENNPLLNRATRALYPPASIFKFITFAAGLEEGIITPDSRYFCCGYVEFKGRKYYCKRRTGHGAIDAIDGLATSCNVYCYEVGKRIKIDTLTDYALRFGLGCKTNFLLPEKDGLMPTSAWKKRVKKEPWWAGETLSASIGQSYALVTPIQVARMTAAVATGCLVKPRALEQEPIEMQSIGISQKTLNFLRTSMKRAVIMGTGQRLDHLTDFEVFAKTGTAQTVSLSVEQTDRKFLEHGWLACYFRYKGGKPQVLVVMLEHVGSSTYALDLASKFLKSYRHVQELAAAGSA
jgi:penicillin-binding protein 2